MWTRLKRWIRRTQTAPQNEEKVLALEREVQALRLQLEEQVRLADTLKADLERHAKPAPQDEERSLETDRELQVLRLELDERNRLTDTLKADLERQRGGEQDRVEAVVKLRMERLLHGAAGPIVQLCTQAYLLEKAEQEIRTRDVLSVARRLIRNFEDQGLTLQGNIGESVPFDPDLHEPLTKDNAAHSGAPVVIRFVGIAYGGSIIRKAGVEPAQE